MSRKYELSVTSKQVFMWLMAFSFILVLLPKSLTERVDHLVTDLLSPFSNKARQWSLSVSEKLPFNNKEYATDSETDLRQALETYEIKLIHLSKELERLRDSNSKLAGLRQTFGMSRVSFILSDVVGSDIKGRKAYLNQGEAEGAKVGQIVLGMFQRNQQGLNATSQDDVYQMCVVGRIDSVSKHSSKLRLVNDPGFRLPVLVEPSIKRLDEGRANGVLEGLPMGEVSVKMIEVKGNDIRVGDPVMACSDPRLLPIEMVIGYVKSCEPDKINPVMWQISVEPVVDLHTLKQVVIVNTNW